MPTVKSKKKKPKKVNDGEEQGEGKRRPGTAAPRHRVLFSFICRVLHSGAGGGDGASDQQGPV